MRAWRAAVFAALFLGAAAMPRGVAAQDVTLSSPDGAVEITGTLLGFDGEFYRVDTIYGELTVDGSGVRCTGPGCPNLEAFVAELRLSGSSTIGDILIPALLEAFALRSGYGLRRERDDADHATFVLFEEAEGEPVARFRVRATSTDEGFADLLADEADIAMALREIRGAEARLAAAAGLGDLDGAGRSRVLALDALVPVVAPGNPVRAISMLELARVFGGVIDNWADLGGPDAPITLHLRDAGSGLGQAVEDRLLAPSGLVLAEGAVRHGSDADLARAVADDRLGLGLASYAETGNTQPLAIRGACGFTLRAERRTIKTEDYPLTAPLFLYLPARRLPKIGRDFLSYLRSAPAQIVIRRAGFVDQAPEEVPVAEQGDRFVNAIMQSGPEIGLDELKRMAGALAPMRRLTTSFRFRPGSARLDAQSLSNVEQLARALEEGRYDARRLVFVGFSDGQGPAAGNRRIAMDRAEAVRGAVVAAAEGAELDRVTLDVEAFGEALPMACDDSAWGRQVNRRVEVWVR